MNLSTIKNYYESKLKQFGDSPQGVDWKDKNAQGSRFQTLSEIDSDICKNSILDIGCGTAEFLNFLLKKASFPLQYTGIDISLPMLEYARMKYNADSYQFIHGNFLESDLPKQYDYCIANGIFHVKLATTCSQWLSYVKKGLTKMFALAIKGAAINFFTDQVDYRAPHLFYISPYDISNFISAHITKKLTIRDNNPLYEFTVYMYK